MAIQGRPGVNSPGVLPLYVHPQVSEMAEKQAGSSKDQRLNLRVSAKQRQLIQNAADSAHKSLTAFVLEATLTEADRVLAERRVFPLPQDRWDAFLKALDEPTASSAGKRRLKKLLRTPSVLER